MTYAKNILLILCISCLFSCDKRIRIAESPIGKEEHLISVLPKEEDFDVFDLTPYIDTIKFVKLELTDDNESLIGTIDKVIVYDERIYILDLITHSLFVFDMEGHYLHKITRIGQGPGEYTQLDFFDIDRENKHIVLTDLMSYWVMRYDLEGNFLFKQKIPFWCEDVSVLPNNGIVLYANFRNNSYTLEQEYNLLFLDSNMQLKQAYFPYHSQKLGRIKLSTTSQGHFYVFEDKMHFSFPSGSTVYQISGDSLISIYQFDFGKDIVPVDNPINSSLFIERSSHQGAYNGFKGPVMENDRLLFFTMWTTINTPVFYNVYYSKESGNQLVSTSFTVLEGESFSPILRTGYKSWIVSEMMTSSFLSIKESFPKEKLSSAGCYTKARLDIAKDMTEDDNSVLVFYKLKSF